MKPVQVDQLPKEYDQTVAQRVLEATVRRITDQPAEKAPAPKKAQAQADDPLVWAI